MSWIYAKLHRKRIWDFQYEGANIHLIFWDHDNYDSWRVQPNIEFRWRASKFKGVAFSFQVPYSKDVGPNWKEVFRRLRISLAYGLNQLSRPTTDMLLQVDPKKPHPIHRAVRTSSAL